MFKLIYLLLNKKRSKWIEFIFMHYYDVKVLLVITLRYGSNKCIRDW